MKILVHTCCADCLLKMADSLKNESVEIVGYFYNPNIHPRAEYLARLKAAQQICEENKIQLIVPDWSPKEWFRVQNPSVDKSTSSLKNGGILKNKNRCEYCWKLRLRKTFEYAKENGFEAISSTLVTSHYQNKEKIIEIGKDLEKEFEIKFLVPKKVSSDLKTTGFYKQNYCGCCYSLVEAWMSKFC
jgi:predicted adenine nucleotide alpha hydrolase (AANH) superfamily ATPase